VSELKSKDGTRKWIIRVEGGSCVETVMIPEQGRRTLCVSSQVGCTLDCSFCATGKQGFQRNLSSAEITGQLWIASKSLVEAGEPVNRAISNVVMMGMGEPLLNFDNLVDSLELMMDDLAYGISKRRVTVSTSGVVPAIDDLAKVSDASLAISLHAPDDALRDMLVPINRKYPIAELLAACRRYLDKLPDRKRVITVEYTLIKGVNDSPRQAQQTAALLRDFPCKINLIPFNPFALSDYQRPSGNAVNRFRDFLQQAGYTVTIRSTRGEDIDAACGQLAGAVADRTRRSERHGINEPLQANTIAIAG
jgi:23S rRNA (adenine2503-C2)-methyltransferase